MKNKLTIISIMAASTMCAMSQVVIQPVDSSGTIVAEFAGESDYGYTQTIGSYNSLKDDSVLKEESFDLPRSSRGFSKHDILPIQGYYYKVQSTTVCGLDVLSPNSGTNCKEFYFTDCSNKTEILQGKKNTRGVYSRINSDHRQPGQSIGLKCYFI